MAFINRYAKEDEVSKTNADGTRASQAVSEHDSIRLPNNVDSKSLTSGQLYNALVNAGVEGISPFSPRSENLAALAKHVDGLKKAAGDKAVNDWLASKARPAIAGYPARSMGRKHSNS
jgi:hypothetical protein